MVLSAKTKQEARVVNLPINRQPNSDRKKKRKLKLKGPGIVLLLVLAFAFYSLGAQMVENYNVQQEIKKIQAEMDRLKKGNEELRQEINKLQSAVWVERAARERLGLVKPGEKLILQAKPDDMIKITEQQRKNIEVH